MKETYSFWYSSFLKLENTFSWLYLRIIISRWQYFVLCIPLSPPPPLSPPCRPNFAPLTPNYIASFSFFCTWVFLCWLVRQHPSTNPWKNLGLRDFLRFARIWPVKSAKNCPIPRLNTSPPAEASHPIACYCPLSVFCLMTLKLEREWKRILFLADVVFVSRESHSVYSLAILVVS